jgi:DnaJ like chaperone protein
MTNLILLFVALFVAYKLYQNIVNFDNSTLNYEPIDHKTYNYDEVVDDLDGVVVSLMAKVAKSNGTISVQEAKYITDVYLELANLTGKSRDVLDIYEQIFQKEKDNPNVKELVYKLKDLDEQPKTYILNILKNLASIDGDKRVLEEIETAMYANRTDNERDL